MSFRVLFVCAANVCRSPTAVRIFIGQCPDDLSRAVVAESAGISAEPGLPWCQVAQDWVRRHHVEVGKVQEHRSRRLTASKTTRAGLILAVDTEVKSAILRTAPRARGRLFTLPEATILAAGVHEALTASLEGRMNRYGLQLEPLPRRTGDVRLEWLVGEMDAARGLVVATGRSSRSGGTELLDPHGARAKSAHRTTLRLLSDTVVSFSRTIDAVNSA